MASLTQIAKKAGVSITAASLVLNKKEHGTRVSSDCAKRIRAIAKEMGYVPNYHASSIKKGRSETVAVALDLGIIEKGEIRAETQLSMPYFGLMVGGIEQVMRSRGYFMTIVGPDAKTRAPDRALVGIRQRRFDGMIVFGTLVDLEQTSFLEDSPEYPIVVTESPVKTALPCVDYDEARAVQLAVEHLASLGHKRLLYVGEKITRTDRPARHKLFQEQCKLANLHCDVLQFETRGDEWGFGRYDAIPDAARQALSAHIAKRGRNFTGVVAYNDITATGVLDALADAGLQVPGDVSVVGHDNFEARRSRPKLTSVDHRLDEMGRRAAEMLMSMILDPNLVSKLRGRRELVEPVLCVRGSTGPAPK